MYSVFGNVSEEEKDLVLVKLCRLTYEQQCCSTPKQLFDELLKEIREQRK